MPNPRACSKIIEPNIHCARRNSAGESELRSLWRGVGRASSAVIYPPRPATCGLRRNCGATVAPDRFANHAINKNWTQERIGRIWWLRWGRGSIKSQPGDVTIDGDPVEGVLELLREKGGRVTTSRRVLLSCLFETGPHRTAEELAEEVQRVAPDVHLSTIYRNLEELERLGVVVQAHLGHGPSTYHLATETHGHLVCEICGGTLEAPEDFFSELTDAAAREYSFVIDPRHFAVFGRCAACADEPDTTE